MELLLSTHHLASIGGSETYLLTVAEQLRRLGHEVTLFALETGEMADEAKRAGLPVVDDVNELAEAYDAILVQDAVTSHLLAAHRPDVPQTFVTHGIAFDLSLPPQLPGVVSAVVAMNDRAAARARAGAAAHRVVRLRQPIDLDRFAPSGPGAERPQLVLALGNYLRGARRGLLEHVCADLGLDLRQVGRHGARAHPAPEIDLADADIVVGYGRSALEGMAAGKAVYVFDHSGGDGWVTPASYAEFEANGFAGSGTPVVVDTDRLRADLLGYSADMGLANRELARKHHDATRHVSSLVPVLQPVRTSGEASAGTSALRELSRLARLQWRADGRATALQLENELLRVRLREAEAAAGREAEAAARRERELMATRRYRLGAALAAPLDATRRGRMRIKQLRRRSPRIIGLVAFRDEARYLPGLMQNLAGQLDGLVALDDGSTDGSAEILEGHPMVLDVIKVPVGEQEELEDGRNHRALTEAAWRFGADWLLGIDADERLEHAFRARAEHEISAASNARQDALWVWFRELWDAPDRVRIDGIWGQKRKACLFRSDPGHCFDVRRVHAHWASWPPQRGDYPQADLNLYHLRMIRPEDRERRVARYHRIDPDHEWQSIGYDYLLDSDGLELRELEPGRHYTPLGR